MIVREVSVKRALSKSGLKEIDYSLNPYYGCVFGCTYCYARVFTPHAEASSKWGEVVGVKVNLLEVLGREVNSLRKGVVGVSTITDPYQPVEGVYRLTRGALRILLESGFRVSIQTKSPMVIRDLDLISRHRGSVDVGVTLTTLDAELAYRLEAGAPPPKARVEALKRVASVGVETWVFLGPVIPDLNDRDFEGILRLAKETGSRVVYDRYNYYRGLPLRVNGGSSWWREREQEILRACGQLGIECHSEEEDWIYERRRKFRPLF